MTTPEVRAPRIAHLDLLRGVATLGILLMNAVSFGLDDPAYYRLSADGWDGPTDRVVGVLGAVLIDQKMMGLFSLLFGASVVLFVERVGARHRHPVALSLWRNTLLLGIGLLHTELWDGDVLTIYALCAPVVLLCRRLPTGILYALAAALFAGSVTVALATQSTVDSLGGDALGWYWISGDLDAAPSVYDYVLFDAFARALALMLIGVAFQRSGLLAGRRPSRTYRQMAIVGLAIGLPLSIARVAIQITSGYADDLAISGGTLNTLATVPMTIGLVGVLMLWSIHGAGGRAARLQRRLRAVGQMALTNYLAQTVLGLLVLGGLLGEVALSRTAVLGFVLAVWALELSWSQPWLARFTNGPVEWLWRVATYRRWQPFRRSDPTPSTGTHPVG